MKKQSKLSKNPVRLLEYLNATYSKLHKNFETSFWKFRMGNHSYGDIMNKNEARRDAFRSNAALLAEINLAISKSKGAKNKEVRERLELWKHFFSLYQTPAEALPVRKKIADLENKILKKMSGQKEGYIDPETRAFIEASKSRMRTLMQTNPDEKIRKACFDAIEKMPLDTLDKYIEVIGLRNEYARILGHEDFYAYKAMVDEGMTKKELFGIFENLYEKTKFGFENVRKLEQEKPGLRKPWNFGYMLAGSFVKEEDPYFRFENVLSYWGTSFAALGIGFRGGKVMLDLLDRKGKWNNGFCHYPDLVQYKGKKRIPGSSGFTSIANPHQVGSGVQGIDTVFHEGGHAADRLNSMQKDVCVNTEYPPNTVSWAETHSIFMDTIASSIEWKTRYAKNAEGQPYPFEIFERKMRAVHPVAPLGMMHVMFVVFFEKEIYESKNLTREKVLETARAVHKKYFDRSESSINVLNVPHIYSWESSAYYHGYGLADLAVDQWREYFFKKYGYIVDNPKVGKEMAKIWSYASKYPAKQLIKMATGKPLSPDAFIRNVSRSIDEKLKSAKQKIERLKKVPLYKKPIDLDGRISIVHGTKKIADNSKSFEDMNHKFRAWLKTTK